MAGVAKVDEPLALEPAGHSLQDRDAPLAVLDQVVLEGEDAGDSALDGEWGGGTLKYKLGMSSSLIGSTVEPEPKAFIGLCRCSDNNE